MLNRNCTQCIQTQRKLLQEDEDAGSTSRMPIVLAGLDCTGSEQTIGACPDFQLGQVGPNCRHNVDVHLVCDNGPNPGVPHLILLCI